MKLAAELARAGRGAGAALIALDEPTTGLHAADVQVLLDAWDRLLDAGHTLLVVDNDLDVVRAADQVTDLGPGSGPRGGRVVAAGSPAADRRLPGLPHRGRAAPRSPPAPAAAPPGAGGRGRPWS